MREEINVENEKRFAFGVNWLEFLDSLDLDRIDAARESLTQMLGRSDVTFLDVGSGSDFSSLAAFQMGALVTLSDFDKESVGCTKIMRDSFGDAERWRIFKGSALYSKYMTELGKFDLVFSWGVLHHTGAMWMGIGITLYCVSPTGQIVLAIYNDQSGKPHLWRIIKAFDNSSIPSNKMFGYSLGYFAYATNILRYAVKLQPMKTIRPILKYKKTWFEP